MKSHYLIIGTMGFFAVAILVFTGGIFISGDKTHNHSVANRSTLIPEEHAIDALPKERFANASRVLAKQLAEESKKRGARWRNLKAEIDKSHTPDAIFEELASIIKDTKDPMERSLLLADMANGIARFTNTDECVDWLNKHDELLRANFRSIPSGNGMSDCYKGIYWVVAGRAKRAGQLEDTVSLIGSKPESPTPAEISFLYSAVGTTTNYGLLENFSLSTQRQCLELVLVEHTSKFDQGMAIRDYLSSDYEKLPDPNGKILETIMNPKWMQSNFDQFMEIVENTPSGEKWNNLVKIAASHLAGVEKSSADRLLEYYPNE